MGASVAPVSSVTGAVILLRAMRLQSLPAGKFLRTSGLHGEFMEVLLHGEGLCSRGRGEGYGGTIRLDNVCLRVVVEARVQYSQYARGKLTVFNGNHQFNAPIQVATHPICAGYVHQGAAAVAETEDACVL